MFLAGAKNKTLIIAPWKGKTAKFGPFPSHSSLYLRSVAFLALKLSSPSYFVFSAKATFAAILNTYSYLTPDMWKDTVFTKAPYQEFTDHLAKMSKSQPMAASQQREQGAY